MKKFILSLMALVMCTLAYSAEVTFDFSAQGYVNNQDFTGLTTDLGSAVSVSWSQGEGNAKPKYYTTGSAMRLYADNSATFTSSTAIKSIVCYYSDVRYTGTISADCGKYEVSGATGTWTGSSKTVKLTNTATSGNARLQKVVISFDDPTLVKVDDASKVKFQSEAGVIALSNGTRALAAGQYMISAADYNYMLASVKINGKEVKPMTGATYWMVEIAKGDVLDITANYEEEAYGISFNDAAAIESVTCAGSALEIAATPVEGQEATYFAAARAGYKVIVNVKDGYYVSLNGKTTTSPIVFYATDNNEVTTKEMRLATVNVDDAAKVKFSSENGELKLVNGSQKFEAGYFMIAPSQTAGDYMLASVKLNGKEVKPMTGASYWMVELAKDDVLDVKANYEEEVYAVTFNDAAAIASVTCNGQTLEVGATPVEGQEASYFTAAPAGYKVVVTLNEGYTSASNLAFYATQDTEITTVDLKLATVNVDNASLVKIQNENRENLNVVEGAQKLSAGAYMIVPAADYKFNSVSLNGEVIKPMYGNSYMVELAKNDVLDVKANYEEEVYAVIFNDAAAIASVTCNGQALEVASTPVEGQEASYFTAAPAGYKVVVTLNEGYTSASNLAFYATQDTEIVTAKLLLATVNIDNAAKVKIQNENRENLTVVDGAQKLTAGQYMVGPNGDYMLASVKLNGKTLKPMYGTSYMVELADKDVLDITANWLDEDGEAAASYIIVNDLSAIKSVVAGGVDITEQAYPAGFDDDDNATAYGFAAPMGEKVIVTLNEGYSTDATLAFYATEEMYEITTVAPAFATVNVDDASKVKFSSENGELQLVNGTQKFNAGYYMIAPSQAAGDYMLASVKVNGKEVKPMTGASYWMVELAKDDVLDVTANYEEEVYAVTFNDADAIASVTCNGQELEIAATPVEGQEATYFTAAPAGYKVVVTLNEDYISSSNLAFYATEDTEIVTVCEVIKTIVESDLTADMFYQWTAADATAEQVAQATPDYNLGVSTGMPYGFSTVNYLHFADLSAYNTLVLTATEGEPRVLFNRIVNEGTVNVELPRDKAEYETVTENADGSKTYTIDLAKIVAKWGFAHLHAIKGANWANTTVTSMKLTKVETSSIYATVNIDNASRVKIQNTNYEVLTVVDGAQKLSAGQYMLMPNGDYLLASVKLNGETIKPMYGSSYMIELAANDVLDVTANWLDEDGEAATSYIMVNDLAAIESVTFAGIDCTDQVMPGSFDEDDNISTYVYGAPMGEKVIITLKAGYAATVDGVAATSPISFYASEEMYEIATEKLSNIVIAEGGVVGSLSSFTIKARNYGELMTASGNDEANVTLYGPNRSTIKVWDAEELTSLEPIMDENFMPIGMTLELAGVITAAGNYSLVVDAGAFYVGDNMDASDAVSANFTIEAAAAPVLLASSELNANGGKLTFDQSIAFPDMAEEITCNVSNVKTKSIATTATLSLDWDVWEQVNVAFAETLEAGTYTLDIPAGAIIDAEGLGASYAGGQIEFTVEASAAGVEIAAKVLKSTTYYGYDYTNWSQINYNDDYMNTTVTVEEGKITVSDWTGSGDKMTVLYNTTTGDVTDIVEGVEYYGSDWLSTSANIDNYGGCYLFYDGYSFVDINENGGTMFISCYSYEGEAGGYPYIIVQWSNDVATDINTVEVAAAGYATAAFKKAVAAPAGVKAYVVEGVEGTTLTLKQIDAIPANTGVIIEAAEGKYEFASATSAAAVEKNMLMPAFAGENIAAGNYVLQSQNSVVGFYKLAADRAAEKDCAYLSISDNTARLAKAYYFGEFATAIQSVLSGDAEIYDLSGKKLQKLQKGINIVNGKKIMVK